MKSPHPVSELPLHATAERLRLLLTQIPALLWTTDLSLNVTSRLGVGSDALATGNLRDIASAYPTGADIIKGHEAALRGEQAHYAIDWRGRRMEVFLDALRSADGDIEGVVAIAVDISEAHRVRVALAESEERYRHLVHSMTDAVVVHTEGRIVFVNDATVTLLGAASQNDIIGRNVLEFIHADDLERAQADLRRILVDREPVPFAGYHLVRLDGAVADIEISAGIVEFDGMPAVQIVCRDVTERHRTTETLRQTELQLQQSQKLEAVGRLAGGVAHDFNNLLSIITSFTELVVGATAPDDPRLEDLIEVRRAAASAASLTRQLLAFGRRQVLQPGDIDLRVVVQDAEKMLARVVGEDIQLQSHVPDEPAYVYADRGQLEQVLMNLVVNARDAIPLAGGAITVAVDPSSPVDERTRAALRLGRQPYVRLHVADTGSGMEPAVMAHIFEPFFTTKPQGSGTGLGLATVYGIVYQSGGAIDVTSQPGRGTRFTLYLPEALSPAAPPPVHTPRSIVRGERILVVEDSPGVRKAAERILRESGYRVVTADSGNAALAILDEAEGGFDLVLTDVVMPGMGGAELATRLRERCPALPIVFMSAYSEMEVNRRGVAGDWPLVQKPFSIETLMGTIRDVLDRVHHPGSRH